MAQNFSPGPRTMWGPDRRREVPMRDWNRSGDDGGRGGTRRGGKS